MCVYSVYFSYDNMGNMTELMRKGLSSGTYTFIDDLELAYNGNQLISVEDNAIDPSYYGAFNFVGNSLSGAYEYDKNGNLTKDLNKNILSIEYNCLNLPQTISFPYMDNFCYTYDAEGRKLHTEQSVTTLTPLPISTMISTDYCDNFVYSLHNQIKILFDGGYITLDEDIPTYHFYLQDHLGSNRVVINQNGTVEQVNHYYPFGGLMGDICVNQETQFYKYNGKELDRTHGLDWFDYGARHYDAVLGRWHTIDPLCEKYYDVSPYAYCSNSPVLHDDSNGLIKRKYYNMDDDLDYNNNGIPDLNILLQDYRLFDDGGDRVFNFWAHGDATGFDYQEKEVHSRGPGSVDFFYNMIQNDTELKNSFERYKDDGLIIVLHMCSTAKFAERLSQDRRFKNVTFIAPNGNLQVRETKDKNGKTYSAEVLSPSKPNLLYGVWKSYRNGVNIANYNYNSRPGSRGFDYEKNRPNHTIDGNKY